MYSIRPATLLDVDTLTAQRRAMFCDMGHLDLPALDAMAAAFRPWVREKMAAGDYLAWFALDRHGQIAGGAGLWLMDWPPHMIGAGGRRANIFNVYTEANHRRRGVARRLTECALEWCRAQAVQTVILHASPQGRPLYESLGFQPSNEMRLHL